MLGFARWYRPAGTVRLGGAGPALQMCQQVYGGQGYSHAWRQLQNIVWDQVGLCGGLVGSISSRLPTSLESGERSTIPSYSIRQARWF